MSKHISELGLLAREALDQVPGSRAAAAEVLAATVLADRYLLDRHLGYIVGLWAQAEVGSAILSQRGAVMRAVASAEPAAGNTSFQSALRTAAANDVKRLSDLPIWGGKRLADATPAELRESARRYAAVSVDAARKARWQQSVADAAEAKPGASPDAPIRNLLDEATLQTLWEQADA